MNDTKIYILCSGFGLGNASRQWALAQALLRAAPELRLKIFTWGKALDFFRAQPLPGNCELLPLRSYASDSESYVWGLLSSLFSLPTFVANALIIRKHARRDLPAIAVFDSDYHYLSFVGTQTQKVSLNQAADLVARGSQRPLPEKWRFLFSYLVENIDSFLQQLFSHYVLVPTLKKKEKPFSAPKLREISLLVRPEFIRTEPVSRVFRPLLLLGGSGFGAELLRAYARRENMEILSPDGDAESYRNVAVKLKEHNPIVTQGGLSSISECLALGKDLFISPIAGHWEQYLNAGEVSGYAKKLEIGRSLREQLPSQLILAPAEFFRGAEEGAGFLIDLLSVKAGSS